jgi:3-phenylpropionate/trans-cinnamate dioxygenase ferredoxin reductase subunit
MSPASDRRHADIVIIGAGHAGGEVASRLRQGGFAGSIALLGTEAHPPYHRPPLSKAFLAGEASVDQLLIRSAASLEAAKIGWYPSTQVEMIDREARRLHLASGSWFGYEKLVIATGGRPRRLTIRGSELAGLHSIRTIADVEALRHDVLPGKRLVIVGGGYIGLEAAAVAVKSGLHVEIVEYAPRLLARVAGPELSAFFKAAHEAAGVQIRLNTGVESFEPAPNRSGHVGAVTCSDGAVLPADLVLVAVGLVPNVELAQAAGLAMGNGIQIDALGRTSDPDIFAAGDCTEFPLPCAGGARHRLESVPNAMEQARVVASALTGAPKPYNLIPWFWSDQYALKLQSVGLSQGHDKVVIRPPSKPGGFVAFYLNEGRMIAADCVNAMLEFNAAKRLIRDKRLIHASSLADPEIDLRSMVATAEVEATTQANLARQGFSETSGKTC